MNLDNFDHVDPFTQARRAIFALLASHDGLRKCFKPGNRQTTARKSARGDASLLPADFPEVTVLPGEMRVQPYRTTTTAVVQEIFNISAEVGSFDDDALDMIRWQVIRAFQAAETRPPTHCLGLPFVTKLQLQSASPTQETLKGTDQWVGLFSVMVDFDFSRARDLLAATPQLLGTAA